MPGIPGHSHPVVITPLRHRIPGLFHFLPEIWTFRGIWMIHGSDGGLRGTCCHRSMEGLDREVLVV